MKKALAQGSMHVAQKTIRISAFQSLDEGRDVNVCYSYQQGKCVRGDDCKFSHEVILLILFYSESLCSSSSSLCTKGQSSPFMHLPSRNA